MSARDSAANATLLLIIGADRPGQARRRVGGLTLSGATDLPMLLGQEQHHHVLQLTPDRFREQRAPDLSPYPCIVNLITEPEHSQRVLLKLRKLLHQFPGKVFNRPEAVLHSTRDQVARRLYGIAGLVVPRVVRLEAKELGDARQPIKRARLHYPVIVRATGTHAGQVLGRFENDDELQAASIRGGDHLATEYVDFQSGDGLYRKFRVFFIGTQMIFRHMLVSDRWNVHARDRMFMADRPDLIAEEKRLFADAAGALPPCVTEALHAIRDHMGLDFFGIDFGILADGRAVLFEANATMNFFPFHADPRFAYAQDCVAPAQHAFREMLGLAPEQPAAAPPQPDVAAA